MRAVILVILFLWIMDVICEKLRRFRPTPREERSDRA